MLKLCCSELCCPYFQCTYVCIRVETGMACWSICRCMFTFIADGQTDMQHGGTFHIPTAMHERCSWSVDLTFGTLGLSDSSHSGGWPCLLLNLRGKHLVLGILHVVSPGFKVDFSLGELPPHTFCTRGKNGLAFAPSHVPSFAQVVYSALRVP